MLRSRPDLRRVGDDAIAISASRATVRFKVSGEWRYGIRDVSIDVRSGETLAVVGESGSGKSTLARTLTRVYEPDEGRILYYGHDVTHAPDRQLQRWRRHVQLVFQDPYASLDPRMTVGQILTQPLRVDRRRRLSRSHQVEAAVDALASVGLPSGAVSRKPHEFSGGQRQRIAIARALMVTPEVLIADEPLSALDVSVQAQILELLRTIQTERSIALMLVTHDLAVVSHVATRVMVMFEGEVVEQGPLRAVIGKPQHPYTVSLISAVPQIGGRLPAPELSVGPTRATTPVSASACAFAARCPIVQDRCLREAPELSEVRPGQAARCFYSGRLAP